MDEIRTSLAELDFSQKDSDVYLAMLQLGAATIQDISDAAKVNRTTTYVIIENMKKRGIISASERGKRVLFMAENPEKLVKLLDQDVSALEDKRERIQLSLPVLLALFHANDTKPRVRYVEGEEEFYELREEMASALDPLWEMLVVDEHLLALPRGLGKAQIDAGYRLPGRKLLAIKPGCVPPYFDRSGSHVRVMKFERYPFSGNLALAGDRACFFSLKAPCTGMIIEHRDAAELFRALFEAAWQSASDWVPPDDWGTKV